MSFQPVVEFEKEIAKFFGAPFAVATDCCTHGVELSLRLDKPTEKLICPTQTYISIPMTFMKLGLDWEWEEKTWDELCYIGNSRIIDAAVCFRENSYVPGSLMCLSFQFFKHLSLGRGGAILCEDQATYNDLKAMTLDGRHPDTYDWAQSWTEQDTTHHGFHYYMTPELAINGLKKLPEAKERVPVQKGSKDYQDLRKMTVFKDK